MAFIAAAMPLISVVSTLAAGAVTAMGAMEQASAQQNMMNYQAQVAAMNANIDRQQASQQLALGETQAQQQGMKTRAEVGAIVAQQGAGGLDVRSGSPLAVQQSAENLGRFNEALVRNDAQRREQDYLVKGFSDEASSRLYAFGAEQAPIAGAYAAGGSLLGAAGTAAGRWYQFSTPGAPQTLVG